MHLSSLTLTNIRQFEHRTFKFESGFNLLVGENGAGKTTVLRGLHAALGGSQHMGRRPRLEDDDIRLHTRHSTVTAEIQSANDVTEEFHFRKRLGERSERSPSRAERPLVLLYASNEATCSAMKVRQAKRIRNSEKDSSRRDEEFLYEMEREMGFPPRRSTSQERRFGDSRSVRDFVGRMLSSFSHDFQDFYWRFEPYDCSLLLPAGAEKEQSLDDEAQRQAKAYAMRFFQEGWARRRDNPFNWPDQSKVVLSPEPSERRPEERALPELREIWRYWEDVKVLAGVQGLLRSCSLEVKLSPRIMVRREIGPLSLRQLSDGEQRLFSLFVDIARQLLNRNPRDRIGSGEAIVMIDEIDVHLHPKWQRRIVPALQSLFPHCQFIATTHSPFVIQATDRQNITPVDSAYQNVLFDGGNSIEDIAEGIQGVPVPQRSIRAEKLSAAAEQYFKLLKQLDARKQSVDPADLVAAERRYREASEPFTSDPAVHALLKVQLMEGGRR